MIALLTALTAFVAPSARLNAAVRTPATTSSSPTMYMGTAMGAYRMNDMMGGVYRTGGSYGPYSSGYGMGGYGMGRYGGYGGYGGYGMGGYGMGRYGGYGGYGMGRMGGYGMGGYGMGGYGRYGMGGYGGSGMGRYDGYGGFSRPFSYDGRSSTGYGYGGDYGGFVNGMGRSYGMGYYDAYGGNYQYPGSGRFGNMAYSADDRMMMRYGGYGRGYGGYGGSGGRYGMY